MTETEFQSAGARTDSKSETKSSSAPSFEFLIHEHQAKLYNFIFRYTRNREDAEDLVQDTFIKAFRNFDRYDRKYTFSTWLYTIGRRTVYNHYRSKRQSEPLDFELVDSNATPDTLTEASDTKHAIWNLAKELKQEYQEVLALKYADDLSVKEIAQVMGKSVVNIKTLLFRARQQLRKIDQNNLLKR